MSMLTVEVLVIRAALYLYDNGKVMQFHLPVWLYRHSVHRTCGDFFIDTCSVDI